MLEILGRNACYCDKISRRDWLRIGGLSPLGLSLASLFAQQASAEPSGGGFGRAKRCVMLFMAGGPAHQDTFDLKPDAPSEYRSAFLPIATAKFGLDV